MDKKIAGLHHVTAIASAPQRNVDFYVGLLGLRLVKRTVNFDDPGTYHFYFGDARGTPGTILTFFPWPGAQRGHGGVGQIEAAALEGYERTAQLLTESFGYRLVKETGNRFRFVAPSESGPGRIVDLLCMPDSRPGHVAAGSVHHIAFRAKDDDEQLQWREHLVELGYNVTPVIDRTYFHSIYFREAGGILFEIATEPPGFTLDEPIEELGAKLRLPPSLEAARSQIEQVLPPITLPAKQ